MKNHEWDVLQPKLLGCSGWITSQRCVLCRADTLGSTWGKVKSAWVGTKCAREASTSLGTLRKQGKKAAGFCRRRRRMTKMTTWTCSWDVTKMGWKLELKHLFVTLISLGGACCGCHVPPAVTQLWRPSCKLKKGMARTTQRPLTIR